jgi:hypothetical protein
VTPRGVEKMDVATDFPRPLHPSLQSIQRIPTVRGIPPAFTGSRLLRALVKGGPGGRSGFCSPWKDAGPAQRYR